MMGILGVVVWGSVNGRSVTARPFFTAMTLTSAL